MKMLFYDLETTGLKPHKNAIHQIAGIYYENFEEVKRFEIKMQPNPKCEIEQEALDLKNLTKEDLLKYISFEQGYKELIKLLEGWCNRYDKADRIELIGYNNRAFDDNFLRGLFLQNNDKYFGSWFYQQSSDVYVLAVECLRPFRNELKDFKLATVAKFLGIEVDESMTHDGVYDVGLTVQVYLKLRKEFFK